MVSDNGLKEMQGVWKRHVSNYLSFFRKLNSVRSSLHSGLHKMASQAYNALGKFEPVWVKLSFWVTLMAYTNGNKHVDAHHSQFTSHDSWLHLWSHRRMVSVGAVPRPTMFRPRGDHMLFSLCSRPSNCVLKLAPVLPSAQFQSAFSSRVMPPNIRDSWLSRSRITDSSSVWEQGLQAVLL